jgi:hypothetical protein
VFRSVPDVAITFLILDCFRFPVTDAKFSSNLLDNPESSYILIMFLTNIAQVLSCFPMVRNCKFMFSSFFQKKISADVIDLDPLTKNVQDP